MAAKRSTIILTTADGKSWTQDGFRASWRKACKLAGVSGVTFNDLRGTAVTRLALAKCTEAKIATITGHSLRDVRSIASLIFVGLQVRQNTKSSQASTLQLNADYWLNYITTRADPKFSEVFAMGASGRGKFDQHQFGQFFLLCRATFMGLENQHYQYRLGLLDRDAYAGYKTTIKEQIAAFPGIRAMWQLVRHGYSKDFVAFMDEQISAVPAHESESAFQKWQRLVENQNRNVKSSE